MAVCILVLLLRLSSLMLFVIFITSLLFHVVSAMSKRSAEINTGASTKKRLSAKQFVARASASFVGRKTTGTSSANFSELEADDCIMLGMYVKIYTMRSRCINVRSFMKNARQFYSNFSLNSRNSFKQSIRPLLPLTNLKSSVPFEL